MAIGHANETTPGFRKVLSSIERAGRAPVRYFDVLGKETRGLDSLEVDTFTLGPNFFRFDCRKREELYKRAMAKSFIASSGFNFNTAETERYFKELEPIDFPLTDTFTSDDEIIDDEIIDDDRNHRAEYTKNGNFLVECFFVLEVIRRYTLGDVHDAMNGLGSKEDSTSSLIVKAQRDFLVFNNQLSYHTLESIFKWVFPRYGSINFMGLCIQFFSQSMLITSYEQCPVENVSGIMNFLDLIRKCYAPTVPRQAPSHPITSTSIRKARHLEEFGMVLKPGVDKSVCSLQYTKGVLEIPKLVIGRSSEHLLQNLMEHEIQHYRMDTFIVDYLHFMDKLVDTAEDVDALVHNEILVNNLHSSKDVAIMLNNMTRAAWFNTLNYYFYGACEAINAYCQVPRHTWKATLRSDYCRTPWMIASSITVGFLVLLTLIQTVCSILSVVNSH